MAAPNSDDMPTANDATAGSMLPARYCANGEAAATRDDTAPETVETTASKAPGTASKTARTAPATEDTTSATAWNAAHTCDESTSGRGMPRPESARAAMFHAVASAVDSTGARTGASPCRTVGNASMMPWPICATRGATLVATAPMDSSSCVVSCEKSTSSLPRPVTKFSHAALAMPMEPEMVVAASSAVVPVTPMLSCTVWMASTTSA